MPDSPIHDLNSASNVTSGDLLVLEQDGQAKKLEGQYLLNYVYERLDVAHGATSILPITTAPTAYTTPTHGYTPAYRIELAYVTSESRVNSVLVGDQLRHDTYLYPVGYVDTVYAFLGPRVSISSSDFETLTNRPKYNDTTMGHSTNIPQVKTSDWDAKYAKPSTGIPKTDLTSAVQTSLSKADTALQSHQPLPAKDHVHNAKDYGAVGDGETDDYAAIIDALTAAAEDGGTVYLPGGSYFLSRSLALDENFGAVSIVGESSRSVTLRYSGSGFAVDLYRSDTAVIYGAVLTGFTVITDYVYAGGIALSHQGQCVVEDITIYYGGTSPSMMPGLEISSSSQVFISHVQGQGYETGCYVDNPAGWGDVYFSDCRFDGNGGNGFEAFRCSGLCMSNVTMYGNGVSGMVLGHQASSGNAFAENVFLSNVVADTSGLMNCAIYCADNVMMSTCWFATQKTPGSASGGMHGLYIESSSNITIEACTFRNNYDNGIYMTASNYVNVSGCIFRKNGQRSTSIFGADLNYSTKITFGGNLFVPENYQMRGILVNNCNYYLVTNNCMDGVSVAVETRSDPTGVKKVVENNLS